MARDHRSDPAGSKHRDTGVDRLFAEPLAAVGHFRFDDAVVDVFPDMLQRSIPGYHSIIRQCALLAARHAQSGSRLYDLGSSLGATSLAMQAALAAREEDTGKPLDCRIIAVDNSAAMIERCRSTWQASDTQARHTVPISLELQDLRRLSMSGASVVAMNFTLQFVPPADRDALMRAIFDALDPGGILIVSEKLSFADPVIDTLHREMYHAFKRANGYSALEISQKRESLERVMQTDTLETHQARLLASGFEHASVWFQCFNFVSMVARRG